MRNLPVISLIAWLVLTSYNFAADLEWVRVSNDRRSFILEKSGRKFIPWGLNYDHQEGSGRLIEDYWDEEWATIEQDFQEMKQLGANVVRIHLQFITFSAAGRPRHEVARKWISHLVAAIRKHDRRHLVTVGLVPWSLDRPGLTSGFIPEKVTGDLDFIAMQIYPETGKIDEAMETLKGFAAVGKPVVIEEVFPLKCSAKELEQFIDESKKHATGWIGFYWGKTPDEYRESKTIRDAIVLSWLELFREKGKTLGQRTLREPQ